MKHFTIIFSLLFIFSCNESTTESNSIPSISKTEIKMPASENNTTQKVSIDTSITLNFLMGKFNPSKHDNFLQIDAKYASRQGMYLQKEVYDAFKKMHAAAKLDGVSFVIKSATRNFNAQRIIWEAKWQGKRKTTGVKNILKEFPNPADRALKILEFSSMPSTSRHHWGTDFDLNNFTNEYFEKGKGKKEYDWLKKHAHQFGFYQPYTQKGKERPHGYNEEKWHWSYLPLSKKYIDQMKLRMKDNLVKDFQGAEVAKEIGVVEKYILGIDKECL